MSDERNGLGIVSSPTQPVYDQATGQFRQVPRPDTLAPLDPNRNALMPSTGIPGNVFSPLYPDLAPSTTPPAGPLAPTGATPSHQIYAPLATQQTSIPQHVNPGTNTYTDLMKEIGATPEQATRWRNYLMERESSGNYAEKPNPGGYMGGYQMGRSEIDNAAKGLGITTPSQQEFLSNPSLQDRLFDQYMEGHHQDLMRNPQYANGDAATKLAYLMGAHLGGASGVASWQRGGGPTGDGPWDTSTDAQGRVHHTTVGQYIRAAYSIVGGQGAVPGRTVGTQYAQAGGPTPIAPPTYTQPQPPVSPMAPFVAPPPIMGGEPSFGGVPPIVAGSLPGPLPQAGAEPGAGAGPSGEPKQGQPGQQLPGLSQSGMPQALTSGQMMALMFSMSAQRVQARPVSYDPWSIERSAIEGTNTRFPQSAMQMSPVGGLGLSPYTTRVGRTVPGPA